jgi:hypothetical protein
MRKLILFIFYILLSYNFNAQTFEWANAGNSTGATKIVHDKTSAFYITGPQFIARYNSDGNILWQKNIIAYDVKGVVCDSSNNVYITGVFGNQFPTLTIDNYSIVAEYGTNNTYLAKFNAAGTIQWLKQSHTNNYAQCIPDGLTIDNQGNPIVIGRFNDSLYLDNFVFDAPLTNQIFLAKYSHSGVCLWAKQLVSGSFGGGYNGPKIRSDKLGNTYISGHYIGDSAQFDSVNIIPYHYGTSLGQDIFLAKIDSSGNFLWVKNIGGLGQEISGTMDVDSLGNIYLSGYFSSAPAYFDNYTLTTSFESYFTAKYDTDGNCQWAKLGNANAICAANDGYYTNAPGLITKFDTLGSFQWTKTVAGASNNAMVAENTDVYITGSYNGSVNFDTCALSSTSNQMYIAKLSNPDPPIITNIEKTENSTVFSVYPNPSGNIITISIQSTNPKDVFPLKITNSLSQIVYSETIKEISGTFTKQIDLSSLPKGIYFLELQSNSAGSSQKRGEVKKIVLQ